MIEGLLMLASSFIVGIFAGGIISMFLKPKPKE